MLRILLSTSGQYKYSMYKKSDPTPELAGPPVPDSGIDHPELLMPSVTKSVPAKSPKSLLGNYTIGRFNASMPNDTWQAKRNNLQAANPHLELPGKVPGVRGISIGYRF